ncbi:hypothetical protein ACFYZB_33550 [Streptomyces sp. NPDC001852]|uniref:hypothetical protein n=1 Tax=Streptomyces sp. NPDC001852 TaxID=3364619 RepID=UPI0036BA6BDB
MPQGVEVRDDIIQKAMGQLNPVVVCFGIAAFAAVADLHEFDRLVSRVGDHQCG